LAEGLSRRSRRDVIPLNALIVIPADGQEGAALASA
jgi:hypothetical protein